MFLSDTPTSSSARTTKVVLQRLLLLRVNNKNNINSRHYIWRTSDTSSTMSNTLHHLISFEEMILRFFYAHVLRQCMYFVPFRKIAHTPEHASHFNKSFFYRERVRASEPGTSECELWLLHEFFKWNLACSVVSETLYSHPCNENASLPQNSSEDDIRHHVWENACARLSTKYREMHESWAVPYSRQDGHQIVSCALTLLMNSIL